MRRLSFLAAIFVLALFTGGLLTGDDSKVVVQDKKDEPVKFKGILPQNWKKLGLTDEQTQKVYKAQTEYRTKIDRLEEQIKTLKTEEKADMYKVLTDAQKARLKEINEGKTPPDGK